MKRLSKSWIFKACNFCIAFAGNPSLDKDEFVVIWRTALSRRF